MLTDSERNLLELVREGRVDAEIAVRLGLETRQVKLRLAALMEHAGVTTRSALREWQVPDDELELPGAAPGLGSVAATAASDIFEPAASFDPPGRAAESLSALPDRRERTRLPAATLATLLVALGGAAGVLGWLVLRDDTTMPAAPASPAVQDDAGTAAPRFMVTPMPPRAASAIVTLGGLEARDATFVGVQALPAGVELTIVRGNGIARGTTIERVTTVNGALNIEPLFVAPAGARIRDVIADGDGDTLAIAVCSGCSGTVAGRNGATVDYLAARGRDAPFVSEHQRMVPRGEQVPAIAAILPDGLVLQSGSADLPHFETTGGDLCEPPGPLAVAPAAGFMLAFSVLSFASCDGHILFGRNVVLGATITASRDIDNENSLASWTMPNAFGTKSYFVGLVDGVFPHVTYILRVPDFAQVVGRANGGRVFGHMRIDPETAVITPVMFDLEAGTYAYLEGALYAVPPPSRLIEVLMIDRAPETIQVVAVRDSSP